MSIRKYKAKSGSVGEVVKRVNEEFVPILSKTPGFIAYYGVDTGNDVVASISVFLTPASAEASNQIAVDWVSGHIASLLEGPLDITTGQVVVHRKAY